MPLGQATAMDGTQVAFLSASNTGGSNGSGSGSSSGIGIGIGKEGPAGDLCRQLWQQLESAFVGREKALAKGELELKEKLEQLEAKSVALDLREQTFRVSFEERARLLNLKEQSLVQREQRLLESRLSLARARAREKEKETDSEKEKANEMERAGGASGLEFLQPKSEPVEVVEATVWENKVRVVDDGTAPQETANLALVERGEESRGAVGVLEDVTLRVRRRSLLKKQQNLKREGADHEGAAAGGKEEDDSRIVGSRAVPKAAWRRGKRSEKKLQNRRCRKHVSVEVALEEDSPGLLESLRERGLADGLQLFGEGLEDESNTDTLPDDAFEELGSVVAALPGWGAPSGLIHVASAHVGNRSRPYCLGCLASLVEQARDMNRQGWPVHWGWCRQLHAFLFVFVKHNRIVVERPEYGFATYFFELVQTIPYTWQVKLLVTVLGYSCVGRAALMENKPLVVGEHLSEDQAVILEGYGWTRGSGIGTLLNFCDRVVHDYHRGEVDSFEWKGKIGKLLMDGYDHGSIVKDAPPRLTQVVPPIIIKTEDPRILM